ncbi:MAG: YIP1 family protein [Fibrobacterota bacterium]
MNYTESERKPEGDHPFTPNRGNIHSAEAGYSHQETAQSSDYAWPLKTALTILRRPGTFFTNFSAPSLLEPLLYFLILIGVQMSITALAGESIIHSSFTESFHNRIGLHNPRLDTDTISRLMGFETFSHTEMILIHCIYIPVKMAALTALLFLLSAVIQLVIRPRKSFATYADIFSCLSYGITPVVIAFVPVIGSPVALIGSLIYTTKGLTRILDISIAKLLFRMILPLFIPFILFISFLMQSALLYSDPLSVHIVYSFIRLFSLLS